MRGKLRDKRTAERRDSFKYNALERRRPKKRETRSAQWLEKYLEENEDYEFDESNLEDEGKEESKVQAPPKRV